MHPLFAQSELSDLVEKVEKGERLEFEAGVRMMNSQDILALGYMANLVREQKNGNQTYFIDNHPINQTKKEDPQALPLSSEEIETAARNDISMRANTATMLYGHNESTEERIDHLLQLRVQQDKSRKLQTFIPLPVCPENTKLEGSLGGGNTTGFEDLKMLAISRILLDNVAHIQAFWIMLGPKLAQVSLAFGVDDLETSQAMSKRAMIHMIDKAGRDAVERDTLYRVLRT
ncbi:MAG TPA: FO synthase [Desulfosporosinus sp.]